MDVFGSPLLPRWRLSGLNNGIVAVPNSSLETATMGTIARWCDTPPAVELGRRQDL
jgi:hypothetical protein